MCIRDSYASSLALGACFTIFGFEVVDGGKDSINKNATIANWTENFCSKLDTGVLCEAIVDTVQQLIESHNKQ